LLLGICGILALISFQGSQVQPNADGAVQDLKLQRLAVSDASQLLESPGAVDQDKADNAAKDKADIERDEANKKFRATMREFHRQLHTFVKKEKAIVAQLGSAEAGRMRTNLIADLQYIHKSSHPEPQYVEVSNEVTALRKQLLGVKKQIAGVNREMDRAGSEHLTNQYISSAYQLTGDIPYDVSLRSPPTADTDEAASGTAAAGAAGATAAEAGKTTATGNAAAGKADGKASPVAPATAGKDTGKK